MNIGQKIRKIRTLKGYKQEFVAEKLGVSQKQYSLYEHDDANLEWHTIEKIATALEIDAVKLVGFDETQIFNNCAQSGTIISSTLYNIDKEIIEELRNQLKEKDEQIKSLISKMK
ncbi:MAG: helix-turn-helix transcriptional regulator [Chitinophagales bacterium]